MKKALLIILAVLVFLTSCATSVSVSYVQPSNLDMGAYRKVAIAPCVQYSGSQNIPLYIRLDIKNLDDSLARIRTLVSSYEYAGLNKAAADAATRMVYSAFTRNGYYTVLSPEKTDAYMALAKIGRDPSEELLRDGYDAVIIPKITVLRTDEWISRETVKVNNVPVDYYYLNRLMNITVTLTVLDTRTNQIVAVQKYSSEERNKEKFDPVTITRFPNKLTTLAEETLSDMLYSVVSDFVPRQVSSSISFASNKPKNEAAKVGYEAAKNGNMSLAYSVFCDQYYSAGHIASGYNAAAILAATGDVDGALALLEDIRRFSPDKKVSQLYRDLLVIKDKNEKAMAQMDGSSAALQPLGTGVSIYDYLLN